MSCTFKASSSTFAFPIAASERRSRPGLVGVLIALIDAFQEALEMRRAAHKMYFLADE
jgi:hypothetical protein